MPGRSNTDPTATSKQTPQRQEKSKSVLSSMARTFRSYWFVAVPAIMLNIGITLDHVIANNTENAFRVAVNSAMAETMNKVNSQDAQPLDDTLQAHWITTNEDGNLTGRISAIDSTDSVSIPIEKLNVSLLQKGQKVRKGMTDGDGKFVLKDVDAGVYTLVAAGQSGFLAYGVHVLPKLEQFDILDQNTQLEEAKKRAYYVSYNIPQDVVLADELQIDAAAVPPEFSTLQRISQNYLPSATAFGVGRDLDDVKAVSKSADILGSYKYALSEDGALEGRIQPIATIDGEAGKVSDMNIFLVQDDIETARVVVEENGKFTVTDIEPGVYSMIAAGKDGFAALSLELTKPEEKVSSNSANTSAQYVSYNTRSRKAGSLVVMYDPDPRNRDKTRELFSSESFTPRQRLLENEQFGNQFANNQAGSGQYANPGQLGPGGNIVQAPTDIIQSSFPQGINPGIEYANVGSSGFPGGYAGGFPSGGVPNNGLVPGFNSGAPRGMPFFRGRGNGTGLLAAVSLAVGITSLADNDDEQGFEPPPESPFRTP